MHPYLQKKLINAANAVSRIGCKANRTYQTFIGHKTCDRLIWTQGVLKRTVTGMSAAGTIVTKTKKTDSPPIGFYNSPHYDDMDRIKDSTEISYPLFEAIKDYKETNGYKMLKKIEKQIGLGLPTTCGYNIIARAPNMMKSILTFVRCFSALNLSMEEFIISLVGHFLTAPLMQPQERNAISLRQILMKNIRL